MIRLIASIVATMVLASGASAIDWDEPRPYVGLNITEMRLPFFGEDGDIVLRVAPIIGVAWRGGSDTLVWAAMTPSIGGPGPNGVGLAVGGGWQVFQAGFGFDVVQAGTWTQGETGDEWEKGAGLDYRASLLFQGAGAPE